ncbi:hypothetical protein PR202_gb21119 [Eleusine coracana subsp. coracana]|uniref:Uncharacterized protein n=1 Tax=Eleusine coracana subsp. coracana TaxID=191504 RepID=A0AAV5FAC8_ELECO|nr:hypothetical protein PR202_gb21119 [Eleusine coracana subsp. coracana]
MGSRDGDGVGGPVHAERRFPEGDLLRCFHIGLLCVQEDPAFRPMMSSVVMMLSNDTVTRHAPSKPGFFARNNGANTTGSTAASVQG